MAKYSDMATCDLRHLNDPEAIRQIEEIRDVAELILPSDASDEVMSAFAAIPKEDIADIFYLSSKAEISKINGCGPISAAPGTEHIITVNGMALVRDVADDATVTLKVNGVCLIDEKLKSHPNIVLKSINGHVIYCNQDIEPKFYPNKVTLDADTIQYFNKGQCIVVGNNLVFENDVSVELLQEKELMIIVGNKLIAPAHLVGYLNATATIRNELEVKRRNGY